MKNRLPILALAGLLAAVAALPWPDGPPGAGSARAQQSASHAGVGGDDMRLDAQQLIDQAAVALRKHRSVIAKLRHRLDVFDQRMVGAGSYLQGMGDSPTTILARLELKLQMDRGMGTLQQMSDGRWLWIHSQLEEEPKLVRIDLRRLHEVTTAIGTPAFTGGPLVGELAVSGLPGMLDGLRRGFRFDDVRKASLAGVPMFVVTGHWRAARLAAVLPDYEEALNSGQGIPAENFPRHLPTEVVVWLGQDDLFPYRVEFLRSESTTWWQVQQPTRRQVLLLELYEVQYDVPLERALFRYEPGATPYVDATEELIGRLTKGS